ncbi:MAG: pyrroline-5-carboxylate reductase [Pseudomonadota bacterium]
MGKAPLVLFGAGRMGTALINGWVSAPSDRPLVVVTPNPGEALRDQETSGALALNCAPEPAGFLAICVKPQVFGSVLDTLRAWVGPDTVVLSIMAGIRIHQLSEKLGVDRIIRVMPNTPGAIGKGVSLVSAGPGASEDDVRSAVDLLSPLGHVEGPMTEEALTIATSLSGCGPAYVFLLAELLGAAGAEAGLDPDMASRIAQATVTGAAALISESGEPPAALRAAVTSPNGVTDAALRVLMARDQWPSSLREAIAAAVARDAALSAALDEG